jgi:hypothetical protein
MSDAPKIDPHSPTWRAVARFVSDEIAAHMEALTRPGIPEREADMHRGAIASLRDVREIPLRSIGAAK